MTTLYWLVKQEPAAYAWAQFARDGRTAWEGVRNFQARNHLKAMQRGDEVLYYHTGDERAVVGLARVARTAFPDPTADEPGWVAVELAAVAPLPRPVPLAAIKADPLLRTMALVRQGRLSVLPVTAAEFARLRQLGGL